jgi:hypothetical protein
MNLRLVQLAVGWLVLCALTGSGTYYGLIELDQQISLQAKLASYLQTTPTPTPAPTGMPPQPTPTSGPVPTFAPTPTTATPTTIPTAAPPQPTPARPTPYPTAAPQPTPYPTTAPQPTPVYRPTPPPTHPVTGLQTRFDDLKDRATQIISFYQQLEVQLRQQGQPLRSEIKSAWRGAVDNLTAAERALHSGDAAGANRNLDLAQQKIEFMEQSK